MKSNLNPNNTWGLMPEEVRQIIFKREWVNPTNLKARILGERQFPLSIGLKPPQGRSAVADILHFQRFIEEWKSFKYPNFVQWEDRTYRILAEQKVPVSLRIQSFDELVSFLGSEAQSRHVAWSKKMAPLLKINSAAFPAMVRHLETIEKMTTSDSELLAELIPQLHFNMGKGGYLRALPLIKVDTKFLENHRMLVAEILDVLHSNAISEQGGLWEWLNCEPSPKGWFFIRPLCEEMRSKLGGLPLFQMPQDVFKKQSLPALNILVVENLQSGLGLPEMENTIAIIGTGGNTAWLEAQWLNEKRVAYWGDIDSWGLSILSRVRTRITHVNSLMMDRETLLRHQERMVIEEKSIEVCPEFLLASEKQLFGELRDRVYGFNRLEQERLSPEYIVSQLQDWHIKQPRG